MIYNVSTSVASLRTGRHAPDSLDDFIGIRIVHGDAKDLNEKGSSLALEFLLIEQTVFEAYDVRVTPYTFVVNGYGVILAHSPVAGVRDLENLVAKAAKINEEHYSNNRLPVTN